MRTAVIVLNGLISFLWVWRSFVARRNLPKLPNLLDETYAQPFEPGQQAKITVIVPARNEEQAIEETLRSLLMQQDISIEILAVNDRSTDKTGNALQKLHLIHAWEADRRRPDAIADSVRAHDHIHDSNLRPIVALERLAYWRNR